MIAVAQTMGIGKRELFEDYYMDEFYRVLDAYNDLHSYDKDGAGEIEEVCGEGFFGF